jgi:hypothetical protein
VVDVTHGMTKKNRSSPVRDRAAATRGPRPTSAAAD